VTTTKEKDCGPATSVYLLALQNLERNTAEGFLLLILIVRGDVMKWYDFLLIGVFSYILSQGLLYSLAWAIVAWVSFNIYLNQRRLGNV